VGPLSEDYRRDFSHVRPSSEKGQLYHRGLKIALGFLHFSYPNDHFLKILIFYISIFLQLYSYRILIFFSIPQFSHSYGSKGPHTPAALGPLQEKKKTHLNYRIAS